MKRFTIVAIMGIISFFSCNPKNSLNEVETKLLKGLKFNDEIVNKVKEKTKSPIKQLPAIDQETGDLLGESYLFDGIYSQTTEEEAINFVRREKSNFKKSGYLLFLYEGRDNDKNIAVIKGTDEIEILEYRRTDGINHGLENKDIVSKVKSWQSKYGINIIGCSRDWLHIEFYRLPKDLNSFASEVYKFCPDSVDQGVGTVEELKVAIVQMNGLWLWWD